MSNISLKRSGWLVCALTCITVVIVGCTKRESGSPVTAPLAINGFPSAVWQEEIIIFTDPALGLTLNVPHDWTIHPQTHGLANPNPVDTLSSPCPNWTPDVLPPCTVIRLSLGPSPVQDVAELRELIKEEDVLSGNVVVLEEQDLNLQGLPALWIKIENKSISEHPVVHVMILVDKQIVYVNAYGELNPVSSIVNSIRPLGEKLLD